MEGLRLLLPPMGSPAPPVSFCFVFFFSLLTNVSESWKKTPRTRKCVGKRKQKLSKFQQSCVVCSRWVLLGPGSLPWASARVWVGLPHPCIQRVKLCVPLDDSLSALVLCLYYLGPEDGIQASGLMTRGCAHCSVTEPFDWPGLQTFALNIALVSVDKYGQLVGELFKCLLGGAEGRRHPWLVLL